MYGTEHALSPYRTAATIAKPYFDEPGCTIHVDMYFTVPLLVTTVLLKMNPQVQNMR
jgi:hypothetical protein